MDLAFSVRYRNRLKHRLSAWDTKGVPYPPEHFLVKHCVTHWISPKVWLMGRNRQENDRTLPAIQRFIPLRTMEYITVDGFRDRHFSRTIGNQVSG
jgi:hypothetical protein